MHRISKFQVITLVVVFIFLFIIGAIYSNTKDVAKDKGVAPLTSQDIDYKKINEGSGEQILSTFVEQLESTNQRVDELSRKVDRIDSASSSNKLDCHIAGALRANGVEEMSPEAAIRDAKINNNDLVILCSF